MTDAQGRPSVTEVLVSDSTQLTETDLLRLAAGVERASEHPLAQAIVADANDRDITIADVSDFDSPVGRRVYGTVEGHTIALGSASFMSDRGLHPADLTASAEQLRRDGATARRRASSAAATPSQECLPSPTREEGDACGTGCPTQRRCRRRDAHR